MADGYDGVIAGPSVGRRVDTKTGKGGRGVGKTTLPTTIATHLLDGYVDVGSDESFDVVKTRLLSNEEGRKRVVIIDNLKSHRFSNAALEAIITAPIVSGRAMYVGEMQRPNTLVWVITANGASLSKDLAQRTVEIRVARPRYDPTWETQLESFIKDHKAEILADIRGRLAEPSRMTAAASRWSAWENDVLGKFGNVADLQRLIVDRRQATDVDDQEQGIVRDFIVTKIRDMGYDPDGDVLFFHQGIVPKWACEAMERRMSTASANAHIKALSIAELAYDKSSGVRGWYWRGARSGCKKAQHITELAANPFMIRAHRAGA